MDCNSIILTITMFFLRWIMICNCQGVMINATTEEAGFIDNHQGTGAGIYYEALNSMKVYSTNFNIITHVNISSYREKFEQLTTMFENNKNICTANKNNISIICNNFNMTLQLAKLELNKRYSTLISLQNGRVKRGLINAVGEFENWAFGLVDDNAYQQIQKSIKTNSEKNDKTLNIMKKQVKLVQSTINQISNTSSTISKNFLRIQNEYNEIIWKINLKYNNMIEIEISQQLINYLINFNMLLTEFIFETEEMIDSLILAKHNILHPIILKNSELFDILKSIQQTLPITQVLPVDLSMESAIDDLLKLIKIKTRFMDYQVLFIITFPLYDPTEYTLFRLWTMPVEITNFQFIFIKPQNPYLAVSKDHQHFITLTELEVKDCAGIANEKSCFLQMPIFTKDYQICEIQIFNSVNLTELPKQCIVEHQIFNDSYFKKLNNCNDFIYWVSKITTTTLVCPHVTTHHFLKGAGILTIPDTCILYTPTIILIPTKITEKQVSTSFHPSFPLINITDIKKKIDQIKHSKPLTITNTNYKLPQLHDMYQSSNNLDSLINEIDKEIEDGEKTYSLYFHQYVLYILAGVVGYIIIHIILKNLKNYCTKDKPQQITVYRSRKTLPRNHII